MAVNSVIVLKTLAGLKNRKGGILCISLVEKYNWFFVLLVFVFEDLSKGPLSSSFHQLK